MTRNTRSKWKKVLLLLAATLLLVAAIAVSLGAYFYRSFSKEYQVQYQTLKFKLSGSLYADEIQWKKENVTEGVIHNLQISWSWRALISGDIKISSLELHGADLSVFDDGSPSGEFDMGIIITHADISNSVIHLNSQSDSTIIVIGHSQIEKLSIGDSYELEYLLLENSSFASKSSLKPDKPEKTNEVIGPELLPGFKADSITVSNFAFRSMTAEDTTVLSGISLGIYNATHDTDAFLALKSFSVNLGDTLLIHSKFESITWRAADKNILLEDLTAETEGLELKVNSIQLDPNNNYNSRIVLGNSWLSYGGFIMLYPYMNEIINPELPRDSVIQFSGIVSGNSHSLAFDSIALSLLNRTSTMASGDIDLSRDLVTFRFTFKDLTSTGKDVNDFLMPMAYNYYFNWPTEIGSTVTLNGDEENFYINGDISTPQGLLKTKTIVRYVEGDDLFYSIHVKSPDARVNQLADYLAIDIPSGEVDLLLEGLYSDIEGRDTFRMDLHIPRLIAEGYPLSNVWFRYYFNNSYDSLWANIKDSVMIADMKGAYYSGDTSSVPFSGYIEKAIPGLLDSIVPEWILSSRYQGNYRYDDADYYDISFELNQCNFQWADGLQTPIEKVSMLMKSKDNWYDINFTNTYGNQLSAYVELPEEMDESGGYFNLADQFPAIDIRGKLKIDSSFMHHFTGQDLSMEVSSLEVHHSIEDPRWSLKGVVPEIASRGMVAKNISFDISNPEHRYSGYFKASQIQGSGANLSEIGVDVSHFDDGIHYDLAIADISNFGETQLHAIQADHGDGYIFRFDENDSVIIVGYPWKVVKNEGILISDNLVLKGGNIGMERNTTKLNLFTDEAAEVVTISFDSVSLASLFNFFTDQVEASGSSSGQIEYNLVTGQTIFASQISDILIDSIPLGNLDLNGSMEDSLILGNLALKGINGKVSAGLRYHGSALEYNAEIHQFNLDFLNNDLLSDDFILTGILNGNIAGTYSDKLIADGWLKVDNGNIELPTLSSSFALKGDSLVFHDDQLEFRAFKIYDEKNVPLRLDGYCTLYPEVEFDLTIDGKNFTVLDHMGDNDLEGTIITDIQLLLQGDPNDFSATGEIDIHENAYIRYTLSDEVTEVSRTGDVIFMSFNEYDTIASKEVSNTRNIDLDLTLKLLGADVELIIDPVSQNFFRFNAGGDLSIVKSNYEDPLVFGSITSESGRSRIDLPLVSAVNLDLKSAKIAWAGAYDDPYISFVATEKFRSSLDGIPQLDARKDVVPVELQLRMNEASVNNLQFYFDLKSSDQELNEYLSSATREEIEVMATNLLLFGTLTFNGSDGTTKALNTYTSKLNELANRNLRNTDLVFAVENETQYTDVGTEYTQTKLNYNLKRGFYNNRINISLGGDLGLYNNNATAGSGASHFIGNVGLDYQLFENDPSWTLKAARDERYEGIIDGDITEYSLGVGFYKSYPTFLSIFGVKPGDPEEEDESENEEDDEDQ